MANPREILPEDMMPPDPEAGKAAESAEREAQAAAKKIEDEAEAMGWSDKPKWRGDPDKWIPADKFLQRGKTLMPIMKERLDAAISEIGELKQTIRQFGDHHQKTLKAENARHIRELESVRKKAFEEHDAEGFDRADKELAEVRKVEAQPETAQGAAGDGTNGAGKRLFSEDELKNWRKDNSWYDSDPEMSAYADSMGLFVKKAKPNLTGQEFLVEVTKQVKKQYADKFENPRRERPTDVADGGNEYRGQTKGVKTYHDLPAEAKRTCDRFVREKILTKEQYVREYFQQGTRYEIDGEGASD